MRRIVSSMMMMMVAVSGTLVLQGCFDKELTPMERRMLTTRVIEAPYDNVFRAASTVIQDQQYIIKSTDMKSGLITAEINRETDFASKLLMRSLSSSSSYNGTKISLSAMVQSLSATSTEIRITIQEEDYGDRGVISSRQIKNPKVFAELFNQLAVEVERIAARK